MAITNPSGLTINYQQTGIQYSKVTDSSSDWGSVPNLTYFYDLTDKLVHYKDGSGNVLEIFSTAGSGGGSSFTGGTVSGATSFTGGLTANTISATTYQGLPTDIFTTGGTYSNGATTFINNSGGTFIVSGYYTGTTDVFTTGATYSNNNFLFTNNTGGTYSVLANTMTGLTVNGTLSATTITATTLGVNGTFKYVDGNQSVGNILTTDSLGNATWQPPSVLGTLAYFLTSSANTIPTYYQAVNSIVTSSLQTITNISVTNGQLLAAFATGPGTPSLNYLPAGILTLHVHGANTNSGKDTTLYFNVYKRTSGGTETLLGTSSDTDLLTPVNGSLYTDVTITGVTANTSDVLVLKVYANVVGGGTSPDITLYMADGTASRFEIPSFAVNSSNFVPYTGATNNVDLDGYSVTATGIFSRNGITATGGITGATVSATTYQGLPTDIRVTGGTYSNGTTIFTNNTGGTFSVTGFSTGTVFTGGTVSGATSFTGGLTANTISATTYQGLPTDVFTTGATYSNNNFTFTNNTGGTYSVLANIMTGLTINGNATISNGLVRVQGNSSNELVRITQLGSGAAIIVEDSTNPDSSPFIIDANGNVGIGLTSPTTNLDVSGDTRISGALTANTISAATYYNLPTVSATFTGGTVSGATSFIAGLSADTFSVSGNSSSTLVKLTQTGSGSVLVVEDSNSPDTSAFQINNDGNTGIGTNANNSYKLYTYSVTGTSLYAQSGTIGIEASGNNIGILSNGGTYGVEGISTLDIGGGIGIYGIATDNNGGTGDYIGGKFEANPSSYTNKYSLQLVDGTEGVNKVLVSQTANGKANWSSVLTGLTSVSATTVYGNRILINTGNTITSVAPERLLVNDGGTGGTGYSNTIVGVANVNSYAQILINNDYAGTDSSADIVAQADNGTETINYIDMGINSSTYTADTTDHSQPNDAYLFSTGNNLWIGNTSVNKYIYIHTDGARSGDTRIEISSATTKVKNTFVISSSPTNNNSNTQILSRNSSTGNVEYTDISSITSGVTGTFNYGLAYAMSNQNYLM